MAYDTANPPYLLVPRLGGPKNPTSTSHTGGIGGSLWGYTSTDPLATVIGSSYFSNGWSLGIRKYDRMFVTDINSTIESLVTVTAVTLNAGVTASSLLTT